MQVWDAIVVGAGPSGCAAAYDLATAGRTVLLLDRCDFPRPKACAGGLTMKAVRALRYSIEPVTRQVVHRIVLEKNGVKPTLVKTRRPICVMTVRSEFDEFCFRKTIAAGAVFRKVRGIRKIEESGQRVAVELDDEAFQAKYVVGADGVNSQVRRLCADAGSVAGGFALEAQVPLPTKAVDLTFDFGAVKNGYGWIFPKRDHLNVGLGFYGGAGDRAEDGKLNRERLVGYVRQKLGAVSVEHVVGQYLGVSERDAPCAYGRVLLAGDAAGLVDPLTAEGIYSAIVSGQAAAHAIQEALSAADEAAASTDAGAAYTKALAPLREVLAFSGRAARSFYANPDRGFQALTLPGLRTALLKTYAQGMSSGLIMRVMQRARPV